MRMKVLMDGITLQHVGELLGDAGSTKLIRPTCIMTYRRCIEEFVFALSFADSIVVPRHFPRVGDDQPAQQLVEESSLSNFFEPTDRQWPLDTLADPFDNDRFRTQLQARLDELKIGLKHRYFRDWIVREALTSLGNDQSLAMTIPPGDYIFSRQPAYRKCRDLQDKIPPEFIKRLRAFFDDTELIGEIFIENNASKPAMNEFLSRNILTHVANGLQNEWQYRGEGTQSIYMPHITRCSDPLSGSFNAIIPYVLADVLRVDAVKDPSTFFSRLLKLRETDDYNNLRQYFWQQSNIKEEGDRKRLGSEMFRLVEHLDKQAGLPGLLRDDVDRSFGSESTGVFVAARNIVGADKQNAQKLEQKLRVVFPSLRLVEDATPSNMIFAVDSNVTTRSNLAIKRPKEERMTKRPSKSGGGGDRITAREGSTVINRSTVENAFNKVKKEHGEDIVQLLRKVEDISAVRFSEGDFAR
jgi:hypothetical protein